MKKRAVSLTVALLCALLCALVCVACGGKEPEAGGKPSVPDQTTHEHAYVPNTVQPGCATQGYTEYVCACGAKYTADYTDAIGHDMENDTCKRCKATATKNLAYASTDGGYEVSGIGTATESDIIVPSQHNGQSVVAVGETAFAHNDDITYVTLPDTVKTIKRQAFWNCDGLLAVRFTAVEILQDMALCAPNIKTVTLPETLKEIGQSAFYKLVMEELRIPASVEKIGAQAFAGCDLEKITVDPANTHYRSENNCVIGPVTDNDGTRTVLLLGCKNSRIPDDGSFTEIYDGAFSGVVGLEELVIPDSIVKVGLGVFADSDMTSLKIGKGLTTIQYGVFRGCDRLTKITVDPENAKFTAAGNCLIDKAKKAVVLGCKASVIPADANVVTSIASNAFRECPVPENFTIPANVTAIGQRAFAYSGLKSVTVYGTLTAADSAFASCTSLKNVTIEDGVTAIAESMFQNSSIEHVTLPDSVTEIGKSAFALSGLAEIEIPSGVTNIPANAFDTCTALTRVVVPNTVTNIGDYAFANCYNLVQVTIGSQVANIGKYAFNNCNKLTEVINLSALPIEKSASKNPNLYGNIGYSLATKQFHRAAVDCYFAGELYTSANYTSKLDFVDGFVFYNNDGAWELYACNMLGDVTLPTSYKGNKYDVASGAFVNTSITGIKVLSGVGKFKTLSVFYNRQIERAELAGVNKIEESTFQQCNSLQNLSFTDCGTIAGYAVYYCDVVESIRLHNVQTVEAYAFVPGVAYNQGESEALATVTITGTCDTIDGYAFCNYTNRNATVILSKDIAHIQCYAFYNCAFDTVYFTGTSAEWNAMDIKYANADDAEQNTLNTVAVYCYSESAPGGAGNYWHYAADGVTPVKW